MSIELTSRIQKLNTKDKELFDRIFRYDEDFGYSVVPKPMQSWVKSAFGSVEEVEKQRILRIDNKLTFETAIFNELRSKRPMSAQKGDIDQIIKNASGGPFCNPEKGTTKDVFGRIKGKRSITASNVAKFDAHHGLIIFNEHNPLKFSLEDIKDRLSVAKQWIDKANKKQPDRVFPFLMWNCLWRSASSIIHGHMQIILARKNHYAEIDRIRHVSDIYASNYGTQYLEDLFLIHKKLGLGKELDNVKLFASIVPRKEKEIIMMSNTLNALAKPIYNALQGYIKLGIKTWNLGIYMPPVNKQYKMPYIARIVARGDLLKNSSDIGSTEIFGAANIISSDPYKFFKKVI